MKCILLINPIHSYQVHEYTLIAMHIDNENPDEMKRQQLMEPVSWYYAMHYPEFKYRRFYVGKVAKDYLKQLNTNTNQRKRRDVSYYSCSLFNVLSH